MSSPQSSTRPSSCSKSNGARSRCINSLRFLIDANLSPRIEQFLRERGHDVVYVPDVLPARTPDEVVAAMARTTGRCLITADFDFSDVRAYPPRDHPGIVVLTIPPGAGTRYALALLTELFARMDELLPLNRKLLIVSSGQIRIRE